MLAIVGTIPDEKFPLTGGIVSLKGKKITIRDWKVDVNRGTPAMIAAAIKTLEYMGESNPYCYLVGDIGSGVGSKRLYRHLTDQIAAEPFQTLALHYFQPDVRLFKKFLTAIKTMPTQPRLIGDAGFMYVAKMGGDAPAFDLLTPDAGELAYLADEKSPHPFYTRGFILHEENLVPDLIKRAYRHHNASTYMLVKGATDFIADKNGIISTIDSPKVEVLEAIGGTGDTITGIVSALIASGLEIVTAAATAAKVNRLAGSFAAPTPATQVAAIIQEIPRALEQVLG
ncbi:MAG TPA: NAD(P)H-hydrate dehydratase [bacterium]|jgi:hypothetical protein|nr:NAD(P)H-hydrate dehydratase [bacterium]